MNYNSKTLEILGSSPLHCLKKFRLNISHDKCAKLTGFEKTAPVIENT